MRTIDAAKNKWPAILTTLGVDRACLSGAHCPCPATGQGEDRFRFANREGTGSYFCSCSQGNQGGISLLRCIHGWDFARAAKEVDAIVGNVEAEPAQKPKSDPMIRMRRIWDESIPAGDVVRGYLAARGIVKVSPRVRQAHVPYYVKGVQVGSYDAMVCRVDDPAGNAASLHLTYLQGHAKAPVDPARKLIAPIRDWQGGAVRLWSATEELGLAEGVETAHSAAEMDGIPVWAGLNAGNMERFIWPEQVKRLVIYGDLDMSFTGQKATYTLAYRAKRAGLEVIAKIPGMIGCTPERDMDWNDLQGKIG